MVYRLSEESGGSKEQQSTYVIVETESAVEAEAKWRRRRWWWWWDWPSAAAATEEEEEEETARPVITGITFLEWAGLSLSPFSSLFFDVELKILKDEREKTSSSSSSSSSISYAFKWRPLKKLSTVRHHKLNVAVWRRSEQQSRDASAI